MLHKEQSKWRVIAEPGYKIVCLCSSRRGAGSLAIPCPSSLYRVTQDLQPPIYISINHIKTLPFNLANAN